MAIGCPVSEDKRNISTTTLEWHYADNTMSKTVSTDRGPRQGQANTNCTIVTTWNFCQTCNQNHALPPSHALTGPRTAMLESCSMIKVSSCDGGLFSRCCSVPTTWSGGGHWKTSHSKCGCNTRWNAHEAGCERHLAVRATWSCRQKAIVLFAEPMAAAPGTLKFRGTPVEKHCLKQLRYAVSACS